MTALLMPLASLAVDAPAPALFAALLMATFVQEDAAVVGAAALAQQGAVDPLAALAAVTAGIALGDSAIHLFGRHGASLGWVRRRMQTPRFVEARDWLRGRWWLILLAVRFAPGTRVAAYLASGALHTPLAGSLAIIVLGSLLWVPLLFGAAMLGGESLARLLVHDAALAVTIVAGTALAIWQLRRWLRSRPGVPGGVLPDPATPA